MSASLEEEPIPSLGQTLDSRDNALNFVRLLLAGLVIIGHTWPLGGFGPSRGERLADVAVNGFFALSGYLICGSRQRIGLWRFLVRRSARILPGFWLCLCVVAFVLAPLSTLITGEHLDGRSALSYVRSNAALDMRQFGIADLLESLPFPVAWDGSLWTLWFEFVAYLCAGFLLIPRLVRRHLSATLWLGVLTVPMVTWAINGPVEVSTNRYHELVRLGGFFIAGMALYTARERIRTSTTTCLVALAAVAALTWAAAPPVADGLSPVLLAYGLLSAGALLPVRIGSANDLSYGAYLYGFPVQQLLAAAGAQRLGFLGFAVLSVVATFPLAAISWLLVERPALRLAHQVARHGEGLRRAIPAESPDGLT